MMHCMLKVKIFHGIFDLKFEKIAAVIKARFINKFNL